MPKWTINNGSSAERFGSPAAAAPPNASGLRPRQLRRTLRVFGRGYDGDPAGSDNSIQRISWSNGETFFVFWHFVPAMLVSHPVSKKCHSAKFLAFWWKGVIWPKFFACHNDIIQSSPGWGHFSVFGSKTLFIASLWDFTKVVSYFFHCLFFKMTQWLKISSWFTVIQNTIVDSFLIILCGFKFDVHYDFFQKIEMTFFELYLTWNNQQHFICSQNKRMKISNLILWDASLRSKNLHLRFHRSVMNIAW